MVVLNRTTHKSYIMSMQAFSLQARYKHEYKIVTRRSLCQICSAFWSLMKKRGALLPTPFINEQLKKYKNTPFGKLTLARRRIAFNWPEKVFQQKIKGLSRNNKFSFWQQSLSTDIFLCSFWKNERLLFRFVLQGRPRTQNIHFSVVIGTSCERLSGTKLGKRMMQYLRKNHENLGFFIEKKWNLWYTLCCGEA